MVSGVKPIPDIEHKIKQLKDKYFGESIDIDDIEFEELDIIRDEIPDKATPVSIAYQWGKAASRVKLHHQKMLLAYVGSPLTIENAHRNLLDMEDDE